ncbi:hypothetical protein [Stappia sp. ES.058]|uniref:hypothetical protein n=1 Tax=Stappia sp. ES.058 TaxID=1881061 RepID=UPI00087D2D61|nr:hypothetical protein [Stappia sp. ES.058]SDU33104.1 hypothetical protein SAMN05428979_3024 [Stappia sp. ES.058]
MSDTPKGERQAKLDEQLTLAETIRRDGGRAGGDLQKGVAIRDHKKRAFERPAGATRVEGRHEGKTASPASRVR